MRKYHETLINAWMNTQNMTVGNHAVVCMDGMNAHFTYHGNIVCQVDALTKTFKLDDCGYKGYSSTTRCLNGYREFFSGKGYRELSA